MLSVFTLKETTCPKICSKSRLKSAKGSLPVDVRRSKTSLLKVLQKIMTENGIYSPPILYFRIPHNTLCLPPQILHKPLFLNAPGSIAFSQEHFKTISYAKFGGRTECIMGNSKIVNEGNFQHLFVCLFLMRRPHQNCARVSHGMAQLFRLNQSHNWKNQKLKYPVAFSYSDYSKRIRNCHT